jgi:hypothetical protein
VARRQIKGTSLDRQGNAVSLVQRQTLVGLTPVDAVAIVPPDTKPKTPQQAATPVPGFSTKVGTVTAYPNDVVRLDLFNAVNLYLGTEYRVSGWSTINPPNKPTDARQSSIENTAATNITVNLNVERDVQQLGYVAGKYNLSYKFHRNILGSGDGHKLVIQEISSNGLEVRVRPVLSDIIDNTQFIQYFQEGLFKTPKSEILSNLYLFQDAQISTPVFDYVQDKFTVNEAPYSIIFKLSSPIPASARVGTEIWIAQQLGADYPVTNLTITPPDLKPQTFEIAGPNFDVLAKVRTGVSTNYKDKDDLTSTDTNTQYQIESRLVSSSLVEGIEVNTDFRKFENFVKYSNAVERLNAFLNKIKLIESYDGRIKALTTDLNGLPSASATSSVAFTNNINSARTKRSSVIGSFDTYERYLYYSSASYETSSFGEFYPTTWPKQNSAQPYLQYSWTSSQAETWFEGSITSASLYDTNNINALTRSVPSHIIEDTDNETYTTLVQVAGHYFDDILPYIKEYTNRYNHTQKLSEGLSRDLLYVIGENLGFEFENGSSLGDLWSYALGTDITGSSNTAYNTTIDDTMKGIWKRIITNLPYLIKTKGTERCLRALINCFGIPDTILRIKEYGGHEGGFDKKSDLVYDRFYYAFVAGYNGQTSGLPAQQIKAPWQAVSQSGLFPQTIELRVRMADNQTKDQTIFEVPDLWKVRAFQSASGKYIGFFLSGSQGWATASVSTSLYDTNTQDPYTDQDTRWHHIALRREAQTDTITDNQTYTLIVKSTKYNKVVSTTTASLFVDGSTSSSYNNSFTTTDNVWIPGSGSYALADSHSMDLFSGSVQEFRYWTSELQDAILNNHALAPTSFQGNTDGVFTGSTSSFDTLTYRLALGTDNKTTLDNHYPATSSFDSQHPNQSIVVPSASFYNITSSAYYRVIEQNSLEWPDLGANRSISSKIRIDSTVLVDTQLFPNSKVEKPLTDNNPPDNAKLGVFLSPMNEVNQDIAEQFGGISIDDYIGDPSHLSLEDYPDLQSLARIYSKKYTANNRPMEYVRLLTHYNAALFKLIQRFVPYRANTQTGLLIEPTILERSKISTPPPVVEDLQYTASLVLSPDVLFPPSGEVENGANDPQPQYVEAATIGGDQSDYLVLEGDAEAILPQNNEASIDLQPSSNGLYGIVADNTQDPLLILSEVSGSNFELVDGTVDLAITQTGWNSRYQGSKYIYFTYNSSGSDPRTLTYVTASRYDTWEAINPSILTSRFSEQSSPDNFKYQKDVWNYQALENYYSTSVLTQFTSSAAAQENFWTNNFGLRFSSSYAGTTPYATPFLNGASEPRWILSGSRYGTDGASGPFNGLNFNSKATGNFTGSAVLDSFFNEREDADTTNYGYRIKGSIVLINVGGTNAGAVIFQAGKQGSQFTHTENTFTGSGTKDTVNFDFITRADGSELIITIQQSVNTEGYVCIQNLQVQPLNYFESVQDYHLWNSRGMVNARYEGCKLTSVDYNVDSPDTVDGGPVITITEGGGKVLIAKPSNQRGTFQIR